MMKREPVSFSAPIAIREAYIGTAERSRTGLLGDMGIRRAFDIQQRLHGKMASKQLKGHFECSWHLQHGESQQVINESAVDLSS